MTDTAVSFSKEEFKKKVVSNCKSLYRKNIDEADKQQVFQSVAYAVKDLIIDKWIATHKIRKILRLYIICQWNSLWVVHLAII